MLSFACQEIEFKDLLRCSFQLNKTEYNVLMFLLMTEKTLSAEEIGKKMDIDRTTVQKAIKKLAEKDLVFRQQVNLENGGYSFNYRIKNKQDIKSRMEHLVEDWHKQVISEIRKW